MIYKNIGKTDLNASIVALGAFGLGGGNTWSDTKADIRSTAALLDAATEAGVNVIDTAPVYGLGTSEELLAAALKGRRQDFILQTKCGLNWRGTPGIFEYERDGKTVVKDLSADAIRKDLEDSLRRLETDYLDVLITHRQSDATPVEETMGALMKFVEEGKVRAVGISQASPAILREYDTFGTVGLVQEKFSLLDDHNKQEYIPTCEALGVTFQVYSSLEAGALTGPKVLGRTFPEADFRSKFIWFQDAMKPHMLAMYQKWAPLCEKYNCSYANLVQAWTLSASPKMNLLIGIRTIDSLLDTVKVVEIQLEEKDRLQMEADAAEVIAQAATQ
ncbi:MAG: aldo/keto reductase [Christensenellaceae bacterium]|jgi:methylglyoxal reductase